MAKKLLECPRPKLPGRLLIFLYRPAHLNLSAGACSRFPIRGLLSTMTAAWVFEKRRDELACGASAKYIDRVRISKIHAFAITHYWGERSLIGVMSTGKRMWRVRGKASVNGVLGRLRSGIFDMSDISFFSTCPCIVTALRDNIRSVSPRDRRLSSTSLAAIDVPTQTTIRFRLVNCALTKIVIMNRYYLSELRKLLSESSSLSVEKSNLLSLSLLKKIVTGRYNLRYLPQVLKTLLFPSFIFFFLISIIVP